MFNIFWIHIRNWDHVWYKFFLEILNVSGSIGYPFRFGFGSDNTHNPKYHKTRSIRYLCRVRIGSDLFSSDRVRFGFSGSVYLPSPSSTGKPAFIYRHFLVSRCHFLIRIYTIKAGSYCHNYLRGMFPSLTLHVSLRAIK